MDGYKGKDIRTGISEKSAVHRDGVASAGIVVAAAVPVANDMI